MYESANARASERQQQQQPLGQRSSFPIAGLAGIGKLPFSSCIHLLCAISKKSNRRTLNVLQVELQDGPFARDCAGRGIKSAIEAAHELYILRGARHAATKV